MSNKHFITFANNIRLLAENNGMTNKECADRVGLKEATLSRYLTGAREPKVSSVLKVAEYFNVSVDWLLGVNGKQFDVFPEEVQDVVSLYALASEDDRRVIRMILSKYKEQEE